MLLRTIHFSSREHENNNDRFYKIRPVLDMLNNSFQQTYTVGKEMKYLAKDVTTKKLKKHEYIARETNDGIVVSKWKVARDVLMLSTVHGIGMRVPPPSSKRKRAFSPSCSNEEPTPKKKKETIKTPTLKPDAIIAYNNGKCGIDKSDQMASYSTCNRRGVKWYRKVLVFAEIHPNLAKDSVGLRWRSKETINRKWDELAICLNTHGSGATMLEKDNNNSEPDPYDTDEGDDYVPDDQSDSSENDETEHVTPRKTKKRRKNIALWKRNEKKRLRTAGKMYEGHKGKIRPERNLRTFVHTCSDTCSKCDKLNNIIKNSNNENEVSISKVSLEVHQRKAQKACEMKKMDAENSKALDDTIAICFDLQQTLPTPLLTTSKVFYLRQLWTYNFCIHNLGTGEARMYTWDETVSGRGSQEIGSCLLHFFKSLPSNITKIIAYSDSCGGQNKNKNICKLFMFAIKATHIKEIHHKFLEPGHTYMECDRDFALIEKNKKKIPQVFIPSHWREVIAASNKKFMIHNMTREMFFSFEKLNKK
ncbi:unnamed protein product [Acanthoscelides obtectus]|uniref:Uncharacterized protein n=1 Tax=Acanthoscelides obtectus TaxID=200917 RepID=A0A9P0LX93_ACAOB|nr:unnamed protein product [Acanthoscelides obtectus]CAK1671565.1 hypothetical protein AOBTE_LOCUS28321 [Acanthoscelides obtectus]